MLHEQIKNSVKEAMIARDTIRLETLRGMSAAFTNELVAKNLARYLESHPPAVMDQFIQEDIEWEKVEFIF